jgi:hypothetical protein
MRHIPAWGKGGWSWRAKIWGVGAADWEFSGGFLGQDWNRQASRLVAKATVAAWSFLTFLQRVSFAEKKESKNFVVYSIIMMSL